MKYKLLLPLLALFFVVGCSGLLNDTRIHAIRESTLVKAGFKTVPITLAQEQQLKRLNQLQYEKLTTVKRHGKVYFIYPDYAHHCLLVGRNREFMQYNELVSKQLTPLYKKIFHEDKTEELEWAESDVWDNMGGWDSPGWNNPAALNF
jgi:hypothetical protein